MVCLPARHGKPIECGPSPASQVFDQVPITKTRNRGMFSAYSRVLGEYIAEELPPSELDDILLKWKRLAA